MKTARELKVYEASRDVRAINQRYAKALNRDSVSEEDLDRWQLDLLYLHWEDMDEITKKRARKTIRFLERRIVNQNYPVSA